MRTTLTIDDDLAGLLKERSRVLGRPFKKVLNEVLRQGIQANDAGGHPAANASPVRTRPHAFGACRGFDLDKLNQLSDELEAEHFLEKQAQARSPRR